MADRKRSRAEWTKVIARYRASGQTAEVFAAKHGLNVSTFRWWSAELRKPQRASPPDRLEVRELVVAEPHPSGASLEICIGPIVMRVEVGTDARHVADLVQSLVSGPTA